MSREFIAYTKANAGKLSHRLLRHRHLAASLRRIVQGAGLHVDFTHVPYRGSAPGLTDVMSGQIQGMFDNVTSSFELVRAGKLRALGVTTRERSEILPEVPPIADTLPGYETSSFYGVGAPHDTPKEIVDLLNQRGQRRARGHDHPRTSSPSSAPSRFPATPGEFGAMLTVETERWRKVVELSGLKKG